MTALRKTLEIRSAPHIRGVARVDTIMLQVVLALVPVCAFAIVAFGLAALALLAAAVLSCVATEHLLCRAAGRPSTIGDGSALVTGLLYGLTLPPGLPLWMVVVGGVIAIGLGKMLFGGLGANPFNPALVARAILQATFPVPMTSWLPAFAPGRFGTLPDSTLVLPLTAPRYDALSAPTPLSAFKFDRQPTAAADLLLGDVGGSAGETCALLILAGGAWLVARGVMGWRIPLAILATVGAITTLLHAVDPSRFAGPAFMLLSGGLMLGALFMATDLVGSPMTQLGGIVYGVLIGLLVVAIRSFAGMPEGVMYAVLLGNAATPLIDRTIRPRVYGTRLGEEAA